MTIDFSSLSLYRWRYWIGYGSIAVALVVLLIAVGLYSPGGLSQDELNSLKVTSSFRATNLATLGVVDLPYHILQHISLSLFGVSQFSIKLPSLIIAAFSSVGTVLLLRHWFKRNIAVLASFIAITTGQFLFLAQSGTPAILHLFWSVWLLLLATYIAKRTAHITLWKVLFFIGSALSLYTPLAVYTLVALAITTLLHPHFRYLIKHLQKTSLTIALIIGVIVLTPLLIGCLKSPSLFFDLLGIPTSAPNIFANIAELARLYFGFSSPSTSHLMTPVFGMGSMILVIIGFYRLYKTRATTQSYLLNIWIICLVPIMILNPNNTAVTLAPMILLLATGLDGVIGYWYGLFPRNPYARVLGMIPIAALLIMLTASGLERYVYGYHYDPASASNFTQDIALLKDKKVQLLVSEKEYELYKTVANYEEDLDVVLNPTASEITVTRDAAQKPPVGYVISKIITSSRQSESDRFYIYKKTNL